MGWDLLPLLSDREHDLSFSLARLQMKTIIIWVLVVFLPEKSNVSILPSWYGEGRE